MVSTLRGTVQNKFKQRKSSGNLQEILKRSQFQKKKSIFDDTEDGVVPEFDCSGGVHLSDSSDSDSESGISQRKFSKVTSLSSSINQTSGTSLDLKAVHDNYQQMEKAKAQMAAYKGAGGSSQKENLNIADLLAMGEGSSGPKKSKKVQKEDSDDDAWEEVEGKKIKIPKYVKILKRFEYEG
jgi:hypothetical protein